MAKITYKGLWIEVASLNPKDKKNYIRSLIFFTLGGFFLGIHLAFTGFVGGEPIEVRDSAKPFILIIRLLVIACFLIASIYYKMFYQAQDDFFKSYHNAAFAGGAYGFVVFGTLVSVFSPYFNFQPTFYDFFLAFTVGACIGGYLFYKEYIAD